MDNITKQAILVGIEYEFHINEDVEDNVGYIKELLKQENFVGFIEKVVLDDTVIHGVEVATTPLPLEETLDVMHDVFEFIKCVGNTSQTTGMHVNMSIKDIPFKDSSFNPTKLSLMMEHITKQFPSRSTYIEPPWSSTTPWQLDRYLNAKTDDNIIAVFEKFYIDFDKKNQSIAFNDIFLPHSPTARVEFRFFGGKDYESNFTETKQYINQTAQTLINSFSPTHLNKKQYVNMIKETINVIGVYHKYDKQGDLKNGAR